MIGVIGGMGPLATADFLNKVIAATPAQDDADHVPMLISCDPRIPLRPAAILKGTASPLPRLLEIRDKLIAGGATALAMPCNTAHYWYDELVKDCPVPFISIVEASCAEALRLAGKGAAVGVVGTRATLASGLFERSLARHGLRAAVPTDDELDRLLLPAIAAVKAGSISESGPLTLDVLHAMARRGTTHILLACTELPIALAGMPASDLPAHCIDTTLALAKATVAHWRAAQAAIGSAPRQHSM
jgi:aspartate racemase